MVKTADMIWRRMVIWGVVISMLLMIISAATAGAQTPLTTKQVRCQEPLPEVTQAQCRQVRSVAETFWRRHHGIEAVDEAVAVAYCESRFVASAHGRQVKHGTVGLWQIAADNLVGNVYPAYFAVLGWTDPPRGRFHAHIDYAQRLLRIPIFNAWAAYHIWLHLDGQWNARGGWECHAEVI